MASSHTFLKYRGEPCKHHTQPYSRITLLQEWANTAEPNAYNRFSRVSPVSAARHLLFSTGMAVFQERQRYNRNASTGLQEQCNGTSGTI